MASCELTGHKLISGHKVSHSNIKTNRKFRPNIQAVSLISDSLGRTFRMKIASRTIKSIDIKGGFDAFLLSTPDAKLTDAAQKIKRLVVKSVKK